MKNILVHPNIEILQLFAWSKVLLAFDYDGTLSPIVKDPEEALMRPATSRRLAELAGLYPCIVLSGRSQPDAIRRLAGIDLQDVVGNHGLEPWGATQRLKEIVQKWRPVVEKSLSGLYGVFLEDKGYSLAVHYRQSREKKKARTAILKVARDLDGVRLIGGKQVVNLIPDGAPHKGIALERERIRCHCDTAIYVGDDETDEDVFSFDRSCQLLGIRVGEKRGSSAAYYIRSQKEIDALLKVLIRFRRTG